MKKLLSFAVLGLACLSAQCQKFTELGLTPPMGWNSWNKFAGRVSEQLIRETADAMATNGMKAAGYIYVNIDDTWQASRDADGNIVCDPRRFPSGMKALADYVHSKGLKFGVYTDCGTRTCGGKPGSRDHEMQDAASYASWGVDYLKDDWCDTQGLKAPEAYAKMRDALRAAGRPILFSICEWGGSKPWLWAADVGQCWRTTGDITACFDCIMDHGSYKDWGAMQILDLQKGLRQYAGPGHWNDPDMLEVGNGMSVNEDRAHFTMWCMLAAPLISGNDQRHMEKETLEILTNPEVVALDQDPLGYECFVHSTNNNVEIWAKPLAGNDWAVCFLNRSATPVKINFDWSRENLKDDLSRREANFAATSYKLRNLWTKSSAGDTTKPLDAELPGHDVLLLRLHKK
jgi:alpha-galactosidase